MKIQENVAATLKMIQAQRNLSLTEFADELGIGKSSVQEYLECKRNPRADTLELLAEKLGIPVDALVSGKVHTTPSVEMISDACQNLHPLLQPAVSEQLRALERLFHLSDELYSLERQGGEAGAYLYTSLKAKIQDPSGSHIAYGMFVKEKRGNAWRTVAIAAPFSADCTAVFKLTRYCSKLQIPPSRLLDVVEDFRAGKLRC